MHDTMRFIDDVNVRYWLPFQPVDATPVLILSAGVSIPPCGVNW
jgi:hypothetical protein